ncbi:MAG: hypothetical protein GEV08_02585 [Acidimicrobiia bacterium]|nr:hypothetical protein [Acidimicrobiia bacterium]
MQHLGQRPAAARRPLVGPVSPRLDARVLLRVELGQGLVWAKRDTGDTLFALPKGRRKLANLYRDPRATVVIFDAANPCESAQVQGTASMEDEPGGMMIDDLSHMIRAGAIPGSRGRTRGGRPITADKVTTSWPELVSSRPLAGADQGRSAMTAATVA